MSLKPFQRFAANAELLESIFSAEKERLQGIIDVIAERNRLLVPSGHLLCFRYDNGDIFISSKATSRPGPRTAWPPLHKHNRAAMNEYYQDAQVIFEDKQKIKQALFNATLGCHSWQDWRDTLPDFMVHLHPALQATKRVRNEHYELRQQHQHHVFKEWTEILPTIEFYIAARMMY